MVTIPKSLQPTKTMVSGAITVGQQKKIKKYGSLEQAEYAELSAEAQRLQEELFVDEQGKPLSLEAYEEKYSQIRSDLKQFFASPEQIKQAQVEEKANTILKVQEERTKALQKLAEKESYYRKKMNEAREHFSSQSSRYRERNRDSYERRMERYEDRLEETQAYYKGYINKLDWGAGELNKGKDYALKDIVNYADDYGNYRERKEEARNEERKFREKYSGEIKKIETAKTFAEYSERYAQLPTQVKKRFLAPGSKKIKEMMKVAEEKTRLPETLTITPLAAEQINRETFSRAKTGVDSFDVRDIIPKGDIEKIMKKPDFKDAPGTIAKTFKVIPEKDIKQGERLTETLTITQKPPVKIYGRETKEQTTVSSSLELDKQPVTDEGIKFVELDGKVGLVPIPGFDFESSEEFKFTEPKDYEATSYYLGDKEITTRVQPWLGTKMDYEYEGISGIGPQEQIVVDIKDIEADYSTGVGEKLYGALPGAAGTIITQSDKQVYIESPEDMQKLKKILTSPSPLAARKLARFAEDQQVKLKKQIGKFNAKEIKMQDTIKQYEKYVVKSKTEEGLTEEEMNKAKKLIDDYYKFKDETRAMANKINAGQIGTVDDYLIDIAEKQTEEGKEIYGMSPRDALRVAKGSATFAKVGTTVLAFQGAGALISAGVSATGAGSIIGAGMAKLGTVTGVTKLGATTTGAKLAKYIPTAGKVLKAGTGGVITGKESYVEYKKRGDILDAFAVGTGAAAGYYLAVYRKPIVEKTVETAKKVKVSTTDLFSDKHSRQFMFKPSTTTKVAPVKFEKESELIKRLAKSKKVSSDLTIKEIKGDHATLESVKVKIVKNARVITITEYKATMVGKNQFIITAGKGKQIIQFNINTNKPTIRTEHFTFSGEGAAGKAKMILSKENLKILNPLPDKYIVSKGQIKIAIGADDISKTTTRDFFSITEKKPIYKSEAGVIAKRSIGGEAVEKIKDYDTRSLILEFKDPSYADDILWKTTADDDLIKQILKTKRTAPIKDSNLILGATDDTIDTSKKMSGYITSNIPTTSSGTAYTGIGGVSSATEAGVMSSIFAGVKLAETTTAITKATQDVAIAGALLYEPALAQSTMEVSATDYSIGTISEASFVQTAEPYTAFTTIVGTTTATTQVQAPTQVQVPVQTQKPTTFTPSPTPTIPLPVSIKVSAYQPPMPFDLGPPEKKKKPRKKSDLVTAYKAEVLTPKGYKQVTTKPYTKKGARDVMAKFLDNTKHATGKTVKFKKKVDESKVLKGDGYFNKNKKKFRGFKIVKGKQVPLKNTWIEKKEFRNDTKGEQQGLTIAQFQSRRVKRSKGLPVRKSKKSKKRRTPFGF